MEPMNRRTILAAISGLLALLSGCLNHLPPGADISNAVVTISDITIETTGSDCAGPDFEDVEISIKDGSILIVGQFTAPNPCHEVTIQEYVVHESHLSFVVDANSVLEPSGDCIQCEGGLQYVARLSGTNVGQLATIEIDHVTGGTYLIEADEFIS